MHLSLKACITPSFTVHIIYNTKQLGTQQKRLMSTRSLKIWKLPYGYGLSKIPKWSPRPNLRVKTICTAFYTVCRRDTRVKKTFWFKIVFQNLSQLPTTANSYSIRSKRKKDFTITERSNSIATLQLLTKICRSILTMYSMGQRKIATCLKN